MAKRIPASKKRKSASPKRSGPQKPVPSTKKKPASGTSAAKTRSPRVSALKAAKRPVAGKSGRRRAAIRKTVNGYVSAINDWRKDCVGSLRIMIHKAAPKASEKVKRSQSVYEHHGPFAWIKAHAKHVNLGFWRGVELPDPRKLLRGTGKKMRHIKLSSLKDTGVKELREFVRLAARLNEIKGSSTRRGKTKSKRK